MTEHGASASNIFAKHVAVEWDVSNDRVAVAATEENEVTLDETYETDELLIFSSWDDAERIPIERRCSAAADAPSLARLGMKQPIGCSSASAYFRSTVLVNELEIHHQTAKFIFVIARLTFARVQL